MTSLKEPKPEEIPPHCRDFLKALKRPTAIFISGTDESRTRVLVTLSHGNEPSGFEVIHRWLREGRKPFVNIVIILGGVEAALMNPLFFHRYLPYQRDLNRCFRPPYNDSQGKLAQAILDCIHRSRPEAVVDMHNTSGSTLSFAASYNHSSQKEILAGIFVDTLIVSHLQMGALMEQSFTGPVITVEVGGSEDRHSFLVAMRGIENYFLKEDLFEDPRTISIFHNPLRLELDPSSRLGYGLFPLEDRDVTIRSDIESLNFKSIGKSEKLGWVGSIEHPHLSVRSVDQIQNINEYFYIHGGAFYPKNPMILFMATRRADIAASDCLFYFVCEFE